MKIRKLLNRLFKNYVVNGLLFVLFFCNSKASAHSTEVAYGYDCNGNLTLYVDQWHGVLNVNQYTLGISVTINGVTTTYTNMQPTSIEANIAYNNLPNCEGSRVLVANCQQNNDWLVYPLGAMPRGVPISIQITGSGSTNTAFACNAVQNIATFYIPVAPVASGGGNFCLNQTATLWAHTNQLPNSTIKDLNGNLISSTPNDTAHTIQWQVANSPTGPWTNVPGGTAQTLPLGQLQVPGTQYYQALYLSSATLEIIPAHNDTIQAVTACCTAYKGDTTMQIIPAHNDTILAVTCACSSTGGDTTIVPYHINHVPQDTVYPTASGDTTLVPYHINHVPQDTVYISAGGCPLPSNVITVQIASPVNAGPDISTCINTPNMLGTSTIPGGTYHWSPSIGLSDTTISNPTVTLSIPDTSINYIVTATLCGIISSDTVNVTVRPIPTATVSGTTTVCQSATYPPLTFKGANGIAPYTFTYSINNGGNNTITSSVNTDSAIVYIPTNVPGTFKYKLLSVNDSKDCISNAINDSATIIIDSLPTAVAGGSQTICLDSTATVSGASASNGTIQWTENGAGSITNGSTTLTPTYTSSSNDNGQMVILTMTVSNTHSCIATATYTVNVSPQPTASAGGSQTICANGAATVSGASADYGSVLWTENGAGSITSGATTLTPTYTAAVSDSGKAVILSMTVTSNCSSQTATATYTVNVNPLPTASISGTTQVCQSGPAPDITFTGANGIAPYTFIYTINGGAVQTVNSAGGNSATIAVSTGATGTYTYALVSIKDANTTTCSQAQTGNATVTVNPLPTATIAGTTTVCQNSVSPTTITFTGANATAPYTFIYTINGGANQTIATAGGNSVTVAAPTNVSGSFTYALVSVQDANTNTCSQAQAGNAIVTVNPLPTATIGGTTTICENNPMPNITFTGANGTAPYTFTYNINGGTNQTITTVTGNTITTSVPTTAAGTFTYALVSIQDASSTTCSQTQTNNALITVLPAPGASISGTATVCKGASAHDILFTGNSGTAPYIFTYTINGGANQTVSTTAGNSTVTIAMPTSVSGTFIYSLTGIKDASLSACGFASGTATVIVSPLPTATITGDTTVNSGAPDPIIIFKASGSKSPYNIDYSFNGTTPATLLVQDSFSFPVSTSTVGKLTYSLINVTDDNGCTQTLSDTVIITINKITGIETFNIDNSIIVYPNPTSGIINLNTRQMKDIPMNIYNIYGEIIYQHIIISSNFQIDLSAQPNGVYILQLKTEQGIVNKKIVISH